MKLFKKKPQKYIKNAVHLISREPNCTVFEIIGKLDDKILNSARLINSLGENKQGVPRWRVSYVNASDKEIITALMECSDVK